MDVYEPRTTTGKTNGAGRDRKTSHNTKAQIIWSLQNIRVQLAPDGNNEEEAKYLT